MQNETVLCISTAAWNSLWRDKQPIMSRIALKNRVLFFEPGRNPECSVFSELWGNLPNLFCLRFKKVTDNLILIRSPSSLPYARRHLPRSLLQLTTPCVAKINSRVLLPHVRRAMKAFGVKEPILWLYEPRHVDLIGKFGEKLVCYFNYDEYANFIQNIRIKRLIQQYDNLLASRSDIVFATGRAQWERRRKINPNTYFIPNGVKYELFHQALEPQTAIPPNIENLKRPIIGYAGWLGYQIDVDLLIRVAEVYSHCSVVLVGPDEIPRTSGLRRLRAMPNVYFAGHQEVEALPRYLKAFNVALIPYLLEGYTLTAYPVKLHEYLAAGRAIVSSALPELRPFSRVVRIAQTHDDFIYQIRNAIEDNSPQSVEARVAVARENTWDKRVAQIYKIIELHLSKSERMM
jgi:glycosyltransferase involved in cell wall biosynthesis